MATIEKVVVEGFWESKIVNVLFKPDVNIVIGKNGTGKTTLINLIQAALTADIEELSRIVFEKVVIHLHANDGNMTIVVQKIVNDTTTQGFSFIINGEKYDIPINLDNFQKTGGRRTRRIENISNVRNRLNESLKVSWISINRNIQVTSLNHEEMYLNKQWSDDVSLINSRLEILLNEFTRYQLSVDKEWRKVSEDFQRQVIFSLLYSETPDEFGLENWEEIITNNDDIILSLNQQVNNLSLALEMLNLPPDVATHRAEFHISKMRSNISEFNQILKTDFKESDPNDKQLVSRALSLVFSLPMIPITNRITKLATNALEKKNIIYSPIEIFIQMLKKFCPEKDFSIDSSHGELIITVDKNRIEIRDLSSGEKQLLLFFIETLLQKNRPWIFIADEPETSLHIGWQHQLLPAILSMNKNAQIIVATHAPEIAGSFPDNLIDMKDVVHDRSEFF